MEFTNVTDMEIPEGTVVQIEVNGVVIWTSVQQLSPPEIALNNADLLFWDDNEGTEEYKLYSGDTVLATVQKRNRR